MSTVCVSRKEHQKPLEKKCLGAALRLYKGCRDLWRHVDVMRSTR